MRFISNGDYLLPLTFPAYWAQHVYTWSFERGAANPDGIMRLPARLIDIAVFAVFGNLGLGYFYLLSCLAIAFLSFLWFSRSFLDASRWGTAILGSLFFALNPIFLGNLSKVGLILAVSMLPLALTALKQGFATRRFSFFLLYVLALNISLLHPFTFTLNLVVTLGYGIYLARKHRPFISDNRWKFALLGIVAVLLNAYFIMPLVSMRTLDKSALSDTVSSTPTDYTSLVDVANTGDIFTGLSLSKSVLKDYEFYGAMTWPFYFLGVFLFYILLFSVYVKIEKRTSPHERRRFLLALGIFLGLLVLATASYLYADVLIKFLIGMPGGWMFRSPLKWQLYMPVVLFAALVIALKYVHDGWRLKMLYAAFGLSFVLMNGYLFTQVYERLLKPRGVTYFSALAEMDMKGKNILFADSSTCTTIARNNPAINTELNQVLVSKSAQVKHAQAGTLDTVNLGQYDYVMGCVGTMDKTLITKQFAFEQTDAFVENIYELYRNTKPAPYLGAVPAMFAVEARQSLGGKYMLATETLDQSFVFVTEPQANTTGLQDVFENLSPNNINQNTLQSKLTPVTPGAQQLYVQGNNPLFFEQEENRITFSETNQNGMQKVQNDEPIDIELSANETLEVTYQDQKNTYDNLVPNGSFEQGLWQQEVGDCNAYDQKPVLMMEQTNDANDGSKSLELSAKAHIACTGPADIAIDPGAKYLLSFSYKTDGGRYAGFYVGFDDFYQSNKGARLDDSGGEWQLFNSVVTAPTDGNNLTLKLYAYPDSTTGQTGTALYDNVQLIKIPDVLDRFFLVGQQADTATRAPRVDYEKSDPTRILVQIRGARDPFFLTTKESYHNLWQLKTANQTVLPGHLKISDSMNGWHLQPKTLCQEAAACTQNADGSYDITLVMSFAPQQWFYKGVVISGITLLGVLGYVGFDIWRERQRRVR